MPTLPLNEEKAARAVKIFDGLRLPDVPSKPLLAEAGGDWFRDILRTAFAAENPDDGQPLVNEVFCLVPKKNSKTTYSAALGLTALLLWDLPNAEMQILGPTQNVSARCFNQMKGMIEANPRLSKIFNVQDHLNKITRRKTGASITVKTFDMNVVTGEIPALTIVDELHIIAAKAYAERVMKQITGGMVTNPFALVVYITTQSDTQPKGVFKTKLDYARKVRDGQITGPVNFLAVLYEFPEAMQVDKTQPWADPDNWYMVNPNTGLSVIQAMNERNFAAAKEEGPAQVIIWASQHLNIQVGMGLHDDRWAGADFWQRAARPDMTLDTVLATSEVCVVGIDGGGLDDLLGITVMGRHAETKAWQVWNHAYGDAEFVKERRKSIVSQLETFEKQDEFTFVEDLDLAYVEIAMHCVAIREAGLMPDEDGIGMDPEGVAPIIDALVAEDFKETDIRAVSQGYKLNAAVKASPVKLKNGSLVHCGQDLMTWCVGNAKTESRGNAQIVTKAASGVGKIDPLMSMFNAFQLMSWNPVAANGGAITIPDDYEVG
ncbi:MAG: terminase large subunit [Pseudomonadota bacterium]